MNGLKIEDVVVPKWGGRDESKKFRITEMSAYRAEKWAFRMFLAMKGTGGRIPEGAEKLGMVGVAIAGLNAFLAAPVSFAEIEPLLDEMLTCVQMIRDHKHPDIPTDLRDGDILDVRTLGWLRSEVLRVHTGFSAADAFSKLISVTQSAGS